MIGTHNSYHKQTEKTAKKVLQSITSRTGAWDYSHLLLNEQLENGVRNFELDIHPFVEGFEVMHVPVIDSGSTCPFFVDCLRTVKEWSEAHPKHIPISFLLEFKLTEAGLAGRSVMKPDTVMLEMLEQEILSVFPKERLLVPDDVRGDHPTLTEAVRAQGWPILAEVLGKIFFVLHDRGELQQAYTETHPALENRILFTNSSPDRDDCAFIVVDNPYRSKIPELLAQGMMLRVRADSGLKQGHNNDASRRDAALASGAQIISTDFPAGETCTATGYSVTFESGASARCNPVNAPNGCEEQLNQILPIHKDTPPLSKNQ